MSMHLNIFSVKKGKISFIVDGEPVAKGRARAVIRGGRVGHYTPLKTVNYERQVKLAAQAAMRNVPLLTGAVSLAVRVYFSIPKSWSLKKQRQAALGELPHTSRPDLDNVIKAIKDGANGVAWKDDAQVTEVRAVKAYGTPCVLVDIFYLPEES